MPRQLPWVTKPTPSRPSKQPSKRPRKARNPSESEDDFYAGTILSSSRHPKPKAKSPTLASASDDELPTYPQSPHKSFRRNENHPPSSSPPPLDALSEPSQASPMRMATSRFDLRDDEWMMVEDELLDTAKGFTRHLHIAEYERLKESIEEKRREMRGKKASAAKSMNWGRIRVDEEGEESEESSEEERSRESEEDTESQDLDEIPQRKIASKNTPSTRAPALSNHTPTPKAPQRPTSTPLKPPPRRTESAVPTPSFSKPTTPAPRSRNPISSTHKPRTLPLDMLDDYTPSTPASTPKPSTHAPLSSTFSSSTKSPHATGATATPSRATNQSITADFDDDWAVKRGNSEEESAKMIAKRQQDRPPDEGKSAKEAVKLSDIPTFLF